MYSDFRRTIFQKRRPLLAYGRATGGRYNCLLQYRRSGAAVMECGNIKPKKRKALLEKVRMMELEVLSMWAGEHE